MDTASSRPYLPDLGRWWPLIAVVVLFAAVVLLALGAALVGKMAPSQPAEQLMAPFRWWTTAKGVA